MGAGGGSTGAGGLTSGGAAASTGFDSTGGFTASATGVVGGAALRRRWGPGRGSAARRPFRLGGSFRRFRLGLASHAGARSALGVSDCLFDVGLGRFFVFGGGRLFFSRDVGGFVGFFLRQVVSYRG